MKEGAPRRVPGRMAAFVSFLLVAGAVASHGATAQEPAGQPTVAYWTNKEVVVADEQGLDIRRYPNFDNMSLNGSVLAGEREGKTSDAARVVAYDAASGARLYGIRNARLPVVVGSGKKIAFSPTFNRDEMMLSVWMRMASGRERKIAQFKARGVPGIRHGMRVGAVALDMAFDQRGRKMALVGGYETVRSFDVWLVDTKTKEATRMTKGENSHNPSLSPDGNTLAVRVERPEHCPDRIYGEILIGKVRVISTVTGERKDLTEFDCNLFFDSPRFIDNETLVAVRVTKDATETFGYDLDVVQFDVVTGEMSELITDGNPCCLSASPTLGKIGFGFSDRSGFAIYDVATETTLDFPGEAYVPHLSGESRF